MLDSPGQVIATALQLVPFLFQVLDLQFDFVNLVELLPESSHTPRCIPHQNRLPSRAFPPHMPSLQ